MLLHVGRHHMPRSPALYSLNDTVIAADCIHPLQSLDELVKAPLEGVGSPEVGRQNEENFGIEKIIHHIFGALLMEEISNDKPLNLLTGIILRVVLIDDHGLISCFLVTREVNLENRALMRPGIIPEGNHKVSIFLHTTNKDSGRHVLSFHLLIL